MSLDIHYGVLMIIHYHYDLNVKMIDSVAEDDRLDGNIHWKMNFDYEVDIDHFQYYVDNHLHKSFAN